MKALILAGGFGTRLYPLTWGRPKGLVPVANVPFLERMLVWLRSHGITDVAIALNHMPERIEAHLGDGRTWDINLQYLLEDTPLGSGGAIKNAQQFLRGETFLVLNGDILTDLNLSEMIQFHCRNQAKMTISLSWVEDTSMYGVVEIENGRLRRFVEKPPPEEAPSHYINAGTWIFEPEMLDQMPPQGEPFSVERTFWPESLAHGAPMYGYHEECYWMDIGTLERYRQANLDILAGAIEEQIDESIMRPGIWVGEGALIQPGAELYPPLIIGRECEIAAGAHLQGTVIGPRTIIAENASIHGSVLWEQCIVHRSASITDSVIGARQVIASNTSLQQAALPDAGAKAPG